MMKYQFKNKRILKIIPPVISKYNFMTLHFLANPVGSTIFIFWISLLVFTMGIFHRNKCYQNASLYSLAVAVLPPTMYYRIMHLLEVTLLSNAGDNMYSRLIIVHHWMYFTWIVEFPRMTRSCINELYHRIYRGSPDSTNFVLPGNRTIAKIVLSGDWFSTKIGIARTTFITFNRPGPKTSCCKTYVLWVQIVWWVWYNIFGTVS